MANIQTLEIAGFRGATRPVEITFDNKGLILIYGEPGAGKSTVVDALDAVCNRTQEQPATHDTGAAPRIHLRAGKREWVAGRAHDENGVPPPALILRPDQVRRLVNAPADQRHEIMRSAIDLPGIARSEEALRAAISQVSGELAAARLGASQAEETLKALWKAAGSPGASCEGWARAAAEEDAATLRESFAAFRDALECLKPAEKARAQVLQTEEEAARRRQDGHAAEAALAEARQARGEAEPELLDVLARLRSHLEDHPAPDACPVCGSSENSRDLPARLDAQMTQLEHLRGLQERVQEAERRRQDAEAVHRQALADFTVAAARLAWYEGDPGVWAPAVEAATSEEAARRLERALASRPRMTKHVGIATKKLKRIGLMRDTFRTWQKRAAEARKVEGLLRRLESLGAVVETGRNRYRDGLLASVVSDVERLYAHMHPGSEGGVFPCSGTARQKAAPGREPRWDTLGVSLFLALARSAHRDGRLVVMDDVVSGMDGRDLDRFLDMLEVEAPGFPPLIVTSHYQKAQERYRARRAGKVQLIELAPWSPRYGVFLVQTRTAPAQIRTLLFHPEHYDAQAAASKAGILLERLLDFLTLHYNAKMPRQETPNYTLGKLLSGVKSNNALLRDLRTEPAAGGGSVYLKDLIDAAASGDYIRNQTGAHYNRAAAETHSSEVETFVNNVLALADALICPECGEMPQTDRGTFWQCGCRKGPRLFPPGRGWTTPAGPP